MLLIELYSNEFGVSQLYSLHIYYSLAVNFAVALDEDHKHAIVNVSPQCTPHNRMLHSIDIKYCSLDEYKSCEKAVTKITASPASEQVCTIAFEIFYHTKSIENNIALILKHDSPRVKL